MASQWHQSAIKDAMCGAIDMDTDTLKIMLLDSDYVDSKDRKFVDDGTADDPASHEISVTNYTGGFGGAGRKTATVTAQVNDTDDSADFAIADLTWTTLGGASNAEVGFAALIKEITNDAASKIIAVFELATATNTNGGDFELDMVALASGGNANITC